MVSSQKILIIISLKIYINTKNIKLKPIKPVSAKTWIYVLWGCVEQPSGGVWYSGLSHRCLNVFVPDPKILLSLYIFSAVTYFDWCTSEKALRSSKLLLNLNKYN